MSFQVIITNASALNSGVHQGNGFIVDEEWNGTQNAVQQAYLNIQTIAGRIVLSMSMMNLEGQSLATFIITPAMSAKLPIGQYRVLISDFDQAFNSQGHAGTILNIIP